MQSYSALIEAYVQAHSAGAGADELDAKAESEWLTLKALALGLESLVKEAKLLPLSMHALQPLQAGHAQLQSAWRALIDAPADLAGGVVPESLRLQWDAATFKTQMAWETLQESVQGLAEAVSQFPARMVAGSMGLKAKK
jgi:hypothetical protein